MNIASIDIGSNTVLLLIAKIENNKLFPLLNLYNSPRLGKDLLPGKKIKQDRIEHLIKILTLYKEKTNEYNCEKVLLNATNAMRVASNSEEILKIIKEKLNFNIEIINGTKEAELSFIGASSSIPELITKMVIDIGGGSTEIIYGNNDNILFKHSFQVGVVSLTENFFKNSTKNDNEVNNALKYLHEIFNPIEKIIPDTLPTIAVAGTPTTLTCIKQNLHEYDEVKVEASELTFEDILRMKTELQKIPDYKMKELYGSVVEGREDVLFAGILILEAIMKIKKIDKIFVSGRGLRYGIIINYLNIIK